jgi:hypothetical protein
MASEGHHHHHHNSAAWLLFVKNSKVGATLVGLQVISRMNVTKKKEKKKRRMK